MRARLGGVAWRPGGTGLWPLANHTKPDMEELARRRVATTVEVSARERETGPPRQVKGEETAGSRLFARAFLQISTRCQPTEGPRVERDVISSREVQVDSPPGASTLGERIDKNIIRQT